MPNAELDHIKESLVIVQQKIDDVTGKHIEKELELYKDYTRVLKHLVEYIFFEHNGLENKYDELVKEHTRMKEYRKNYYVKNKDKLMEYQKTYQKTYKDKKNTEK